MNSMNDSIPQGGSVWTKLRLFASNRGPLNLPQFASKSFEKLKKDGTTRYNKYCSGFHVLFSKKTQMELEWIISKTFFLHVWLGFGIGVGLSIFFGSVSKKSSSQNIVNNMFFAGLKEKLENTDNRIIMIKPRQVYTLRYPQASPT